MEKPLALLDAGCGSNFHPELSAAVAETRFDGSLVTGLDVDAEALAAHPYLHERIVGSVETCPLPLEAFDGVVCWNLLEHLQDPYRALRNLTRALKPRGTMILAFPNVLSFKGVVTKMTPYWFHRCVYRRVYRLPLEPYPTVLRWSLRPAAFRRWAEEAGFKVDLRLLDSTPFLGWRSECRVVLRKPA